MKISRISTLSLIANCVLGLSACSSVGNSFENLGKVDYKSAAQAPTLEIPPDLTKLQENDRYKVPRAGGVALSNYASQATNAQNSSTALNVQTTMHIERSGSRRWLVVEQAPQALWTKVNTFWQDAGFNIAKNNPEIGILETDWAENRAKLPQDFIRESLGKVFDSLYSTGERDKFRTRVELRPDGATDIYITHRGMEEVLTGSSKETSRWMPRDNDPELEAEFLARLMVYLGMQEQQARAQVQQASDTQAAKPVKADVHLEKSPQLQIVAAYPFAEGWRQVGVALDRSGFTVDDRNREQGRYFIRYASAEETQQNSGFFDRIFSGKAEDTSKVPRYQILVRANGDQGSVISVANLQGAPDNSATANKMLEVLLEQLR